MGGKAAADSLLAMRRTGDFSKASTKQYEAKWKQLYGHDFWMSKAFAEVVYRCPILLDAVASEMQRKVGAAGGWGHVAVVQQRAGAGYAGSAILALRGGKEMMSCVPCGRVLPVAQGAAHASILTTIVKQP